MSATIVRLSEFGGKRISRAKQRLSSHPAEQRLPLEPADFVGQTIFWPVSRLDDRSFDRALRLCAVQAIVDLRESAILGGSRTLHHARCAAIRRWKISYIRLGALMSAAEKQALLPFEIGACFAELLEGSLDVAQKLREVSKRGAVLVIYPDDGSRLQIFSAASSQFGIACDPSGVVLRTLPRQVPQSRPTALTFRLHRSGV